MQNKINNKQAIKLKNNIANFLQSNQFKIINKQKIYNQNNHKQAILELLAYDNFVNKN